MTILRGCQYQEKVRRTIKEELTWPNEFRSLDEAREKIKERIINNYNKIYVHSP